MSETDRQNFMCLLRMLKMDEEFCLFASFDDGMMQKMQ